MLILLPTAVLINWQREFEKWTPKKSIKVDVYAMSNGRELESNIENWEVNEYIYSILTLRRKKEEC